MTGEILSVSYQENGRIFDYFAEVAINAGYENFKCSAKISEDDYDDFQYGRLKTLEVYYLKPECWLTDNIDDAAIHDKTERLLRAVFLGALMALIACFRDGLGGKFTIRYFVKDL